MAPTWLKQVIVVHARLGRPCLRCPVHEDRLVLKRLRSRCRTLLWQHNRFLIESETALFQEILDCFLVFPWSAEALRGPETTQRCRLFVTVKTIVFRLNVRVVRLNHSVERTCDLIHFLLFMFRLLVNYRLDLGRLVASHLPELGLGAGLFGGAIWVALGVGVGHVRLGLSTPLGVLFLAVSVDVEDYVVAGLLVPVGACLRLVVG